MRMLSARLARFAAGVLFGLGFLAIPAKTMQAQKAIGSVSTAFRAVGPNDKILIERFDDPKVTNVSCYVSRAVTGGVSGAMGFAEDPSRMSIACRATGPVGMHPDIGTGPEGEAVFSSRASAVFKTITVTRFYDAERRVLVYLVWSAKLVNGSPYNAVTAVPVQ